MAHTIKYVTVPLDKKPKSDKFEYIQKEYGLNKGYRSLNVFKDALTETDYDALGMLLTSDQYHSLLKRVHKPGRPYESTITPENKGKVIELAEKATAGKLKLTSGGFNLESITKTSENFMPTLKKLLTHKNAPLSYNDAEEYLLNVTKHKGKSAFSEFYSNKKAEPMPLNCQNKILVYVDDVLKGEMTLAGENSIKDDFWGKVTTYKIKLKFDKNVKHVKWQNLSHNSDFEKSIDSDVREQILKEKKIRY